LDEVNHVLLSHYANRAPRPQFTTLFFADWHGWANFDSRNRKNNFFHSKLRTLREHRGSGSQANCQTSGDGEPAPKERLPPRQLRTKRCVGVEANCACIAPELLSSLDYVKLWITSKRRRGSGKFAVVCLMLFLWLGTFALTVSPELHRLLHKDARSAHHQCLITQISQHSLLVTFAPVVAPAAPHAGMGPLCFAVTEFFPTIDYLLSPSRAPPSVTSTITVVG